MVTVHLDRAVRWAPGTTALRGKPHRRSPLFAGTSFSHAVECCDPPAWANARYSAEPLIRDRYARLLYCNSRSKARPARERSSLSSRVPSLSRSAALKRSATTFRYSPFETVPSLSGSAAANSPDASGLSTRADRGYHRDRGRPCRRPSKLPSWLPRGRRSRHCRHRAPASPGSAWVRRKPAKRRRKTPGSGN